MFGMMVILLGAIIGVTIGAATSTVVTTKMSLVVME